MHSEINQDEKADLISSLRVYCNNDPLTAYVHAHYMATCDI